MAKKPRENRVPIMMSDDEVTAIDDWRFANRIATRSDAVRQLAEIGLRVHSQAHAFAQEANEKILDVNSIDSELNAFFERLTTVEDKEKARHMLADYMVSMMTHYDSVRDVAWDIYKAAMMIVHKSSELTEPSLSEDEFAELIGDYQSRYRELG
ncbi:hypothetical protein GTW25_05810 [Aliihoeflea aestuarii]|jgi:hypothetical protein|uniref:hypothetical protein n=1 Tax=Aliihoeflea aestuarii TaxID=453840 RepID=UPI002092430C|nr:hypothetical protein [Aliihoeflea aestuarii]MCO6390541.1 hypothetical protein [Aliihoeflea aestuarii]